MAASYLPHLLVMSLEELKMFPEHLFHSLQSRVFNGDRMLRIPVALTAHGTAEKFTII